MSVKKI